MSTMTVLGVEVDLSDDADEHFWIQTPLGEVLFNRLSDGRWDWCWNYKIRAADDFDSLDRDALFKTRELAIEDADRSLQSIVDRIKKLPASSPIFRKST